MTTRLRTWILLAGLSALFVAVGGLVGGTSGIAIFLVIAVGFNFAMYWFSDRLALKMSRARPLEPGQAADLVADVEDLAQRARIPVEAVRAHGGDDLGPTGDEVLVHSERDGDRRRGRHRDLRAEDGIAQDRLRLEHWERAARGEHL